MSEHVDATGTSIAFDTVGAGPDLVFFHAGIADRAMWGPQVEEFGGRFRCTTPDVRGFGDTPVGSVPFSRRDDLATVLDGCRAAAAGIPGAELVEIADTAHLPNLERPAELNEALERFLG